MFCDHIHSSLRIVWRTFSMSRVISRFINTLDFILRNLWMKIMTNILHISSRNILINNNTFIFFLLLSIVHLTIGKIKLITMTNESSPKGTIILCKRIYIKYAILVETRCHCSTLNTNVDKYNWRFVSIPFAFLKEFLYFGKLFFDFKD